MAVSKRSIPHHLNEISSKLIQYIIKRYIKEEHLAHTATLLVSNVAISTKRDRSIRAKLVALNVNKDILSTNHLLSIVKISVQNSRDLKHYF